MIMVVMSSLRVTFLVVIIKLLLQARGTSSKNVGEVAVFNSNPLKFNVFIDRKRERRLLTIRGGNNEEDPSNRSNRELVLGKDRELVHFSVDLKWVWSKLTDKSTYIDFMRSSWREIRNLAGVVDSGSEFKAIAIEILRDIRLTNSGSCIKLFQGNMKLAEWLATNTGRFILIYIEDGDVKMPSPSSIKYRHSLGDSNLGKYINDEFVFYSGSTQHKSTRQMISALLTGKNFPVLAMLAPRKNPKEPVPQVLAVMRLATADINPETILEFLQRYREIHRSKLECLMDSNRDPDAIAGDIESTPSENEDRGIRSDVQEYSSFFDRDNQSEGDKESGDALDRSWGSMSVADSLARAVPINDLFKSEDAGRRSLVAVTVAMRSGLQFQQHFESTETLETVAKWGMSSHAIADDGSEEFFILQPAVRFTPSNLKRTLKELRLPRSVVLSVVKKTKKSVAAFAAAALQAPEGSDKPEYRTYIPPGAPV